MGISPYGLGLIAVPILLSLTLHEFGHARVALAFGDDTAKQMGRVSLNPLVHLDPIGTLCFLFGPVGWAKPVPVLVSNLRPPRLADLAVSLAGVGMNVVLILLGSAGLIAMALPGARVDSLPQSQVTPVGVAAFMLTEMIIINTNLIVFNLIPLYPLDGHHVLREMLPARMHAAYGEWQHRSGRLALLALLVVPWLIRLVSPGVRFNPIGNLLRLISFPVLRAVLPGDAQFLAADALERYWPFLPY